MSLEPRDLHDDSESELNHQVKYTSCDKISARLVHKMCTPPAVANSAKRYDSLRTSHPAEASALDHLDSGL